MHKGGNSCYWENKAYEVFKYLELIADFLSYAFELGSSLQKLKKWKSNFTKN